MGWSLGDGCGMVMMVMMGVGWSLRDGCGMVARGMWVGWSLGSWVWDGHLGDWCDGPGNSPRHTM